MPEPLLRHVIELEIPFHDVDAMRVAWHGHYLKYFEIARCALLRAIDYDHPDMEASGYLWPVVESHVKYARPLFYGQRVQVEATLIEYELRLKVGYQILDVRTAQRLTSGHTIQVAINAQTQEMEFSTPECIRKKLGAFL